MTLCLNASCQNRADTITSRSLNLIKIQDLNNLNLNFCDTFSLELTGLYPIQKSLPSLTNDSILLKQILIENHFKQVDWGSGNWEKGPRFIYIKFKRGDCTCTVYKKYYYNQKDNSGFYDLRVTERLICNSMKNMDY